MGAGIIRRGVLTAALSALASPSSVGPAAAQAPSTAAPAADGRFRAMVERPLFSPSRRPPPPVAVLAPPVLPDLPPSGPDLALSGVIAGGGGGVALVRRPQDAAPVRVALGGQVDGWTLAEIHPRAVVLRRDGRSVTVELPAPPR